MKKIYVYDHQKFKQETFLSLFKLNGTLQVGEKYYFVEYGSDQLIGSFLCVHIDVLKLGDLTEMHSFLDENCDLEIYREILSELRLFKNEDLLTAGIFTRIPNSKRYYFDPKNEVEKEPEKKEKAKLTRYSNNFKIW